MINISKSKFAKLLFNSYKLSALEASGVDNWEWYGESFDEEYWEIMGMTDEEIIKRLGGRI